MKPPRLVRRLLLALAPRNWRASYMDDLDETFARHAARHGRPDARRWYRRQALASIAALLGARRRSPGGPRPRGGHAVMAFRHAARRLLRAPGFAALTICTLALAFAANLAVFVLVHSVLLAPLPYEEPDRLVAVGHRLPGLGIATTGQAQGAWFMYRRSSKSFETIGIYNDNVVNLTEPGLEAERVRIAMTSFEVFEALGVRPLLGHLPGEAADPNGLPPTVLSWGLWQRRYGGDLSIVGRPVEINGRARPVTAVMPRSFAFPSRETDVWMQQGYDEREGRLGEFVGGSVARLRAGVSVAQAEAELDAIIARMPEALGDVTEDWLRRSGLTARVEPLKGSIVRSARTPLALTLGATMLVLLLAGANVANLFVIRTEQRSAEIGVRRALGASSRHVFLTFLAEAVLTSAAAAAMALLLSRLAVRQILQHAAGFIPRAEDVAMGGPAVMWLAGLASVSALALAVVGFARSRGVSLRDPGRSESSSPAQVRLRSWLAGAQVALAFAVVCVALLLFRSFWNLTTLDPGFEARQVMAFDVSLPFRSYDSFAKAAAFHSSLDERLRALPQIEAAGATMGLPIAKSEVTPFLESVVFVEQPSGPSLEVANVNWRLATPGYFETLRMPMRMGRWFTPGDHFDATFPVVVSETFARRRLDGAPLGRRIRHFADPNLWTVVGVVGDVFDDGARAGPGETVYVPVLDQTRATPYVPSHMTHVVRTRSTLDALTIRQVVRDIDPTVPVARIQLMSAVVSDSIAVDALVLSLVAAAAGLAVLVGLVGVAAALSYAIATRRREFGVRLALGATPARLRALVLGRAGVMVGTGILAGAVVAGAASSVMGSMLFGVAALDGSTYIVSAAGLGLAVTITLGVASRGLSKIEPNEALR